MLVREIKGGRRKLVYKRGTEEQKVDQDVGTRRKIRETDKEIRTHSRFLSIKWTF